MVLLFVQATFLRVFCFVFFAVVVEVALILKCATLDLHKNTLTHSAATSKSRSRAAASAAPECKQEAPLIRAAGDDARLLLPAGPLQTEARESGGPRETQTTDDGGLK